MIDKKPFRVTNEQAKALKGEGRPANCEDCHSCPAEPLCSSNIRTASIVAADLIDSRELIDKQEALIKEMREFISEAVYTHPSQKEMAKAFLEKTKEYA